MAKKASRGKSRVASRKPAVQFPTWAPEDAAALSAWEATTCARCVGYFGGHCKVLLGAKARGTSPQWIGDNSGPRCLRFKDRATYLSKRQKLKRKEIQLDLF